MGLPLGADVRYASLCDGIGAVHCAWQPLSWECAWTSEIDRFPIAVADLRWGFRNLGDMTEITGDMIDEHGRLDLLVGGTPCQSFSVAGLRGGLDDARGNLALRFMQLCAAARPRWVVWENVPGVLSVDGGRAFGSILGALEELGYGWAYRTLDAQWFGVAQRRRRVFVVGHIGDWRRAAAVLFERESVRGDPPTREAPREAAASVAGRGAAGASWWDGGQLSQTLDAVLSKGQTMPEKNRFPAVLEPVAHTSDGVVADPITTTEGKSWTNEGNMFRLRNCVQQPYTKAKRAQSASDDESWKHGEVSPTLNHFDVGDTRATTVVAFTQNQRDEVRDLGDAAGTLNGPGTHQSTHVAEAFPIIADADRKDSAAITPSPDAEGRVRLRDPGLGIGVPGDPMFTLQATKPHAVAEAFSVREDAKAGNFSATPTDVGLAVQAHQPSVQSHHAQIFVAQPMAVRRLTPRECERLQGFPDDYTLIPRRRKPAEDCPDGPRYRALGNSMAVPVMRWIGERIEAVDRIPSNPSGDPHVH
jgi:DNA (cytosine-5)-methyltransferase 1